MMLENQCNYCGNWNGDHHDQCPKTPEDMEIWQAGVDAAKDGSDCYADIGSTFWLGWLIWLCKKDLNSDADAS
jgi:hypothetical protein